ncbi:MAG: CpaF family protein, partial [Erythrobacter sp.]|nr:CpaF family protein [Erythrobacter sp.]
MSAFGRKSGAAGMSGGARPSFGVARPMRGGAPAPRQPGDDSGASLPGGEQFPPMPNEGAPVDTPSSSRQGDAMSRLADRSNAVHDNTSELGGFEASVH